MLIQPLNKMNQTGHLNVISMNMCYVQTMQASYGALAGYHNGVFLPLCTSKQDKHSECQVTKQ